MYLDNCIESKIVKLNYMAKNELEQGLRNNILHQNFE